LNEGNPDQQQQYLPLGVERNGLMRQSLLTPPTTDPSPLFDAIDSQYASYVLDVAVVHFHIFDLLAARSYSAEELQLALKLAPRAANVLFTALNAMALVTHSDGGEFNLTDLAREHLHKKSVYETDRYFGLRAQSPEVLAFASRLRSNALGNQFIYRRGDPCLMDDKGHCRDMTLSLVGRAKPVAPYLVRHMPLSDASVLMDLGCGSGIYSIACLQAFPHLRVVAVDHANVLEVTRELANDYGVASRMEFISADMFSDSIPSGCDVVLVSNVLHDWDVADCQDLLRRCSASLVQGGKLVIHDYFLCGEFDASLPVALHSASLFCMTHGRVYGTAEYKEWLRAASLFATQPIIPTRTHLGMLVANKDG
jgi:ubiquinone/menaquinone biosynthesis C-methylase UbiE